ncbi:MAG: alpha/beta hydrolase family protein [Pirellulaceae bacterium]
MHSRPLHTHTDLSLLCATASAGGAARNGRLTIALTLALAVCSTGLRSLAGADPSLDRPQDEIWLVSTRHVIRAGSGEDPGLRAQRLVPGTGWQPADIHELYAPATPDQIMVVFVHGNRVPHESVIPEGRRMYRLLTAGVADAPPMRFVIWSWPSAQIRGQLRDVREKARRTELAGYCLAWLLRQLPESQHVSVLGYSFGARIASGAMHLIGGGQLSGRALPGPSIGSPNTRVVMMAAALHSNWLRPGGYHGLAVSQLDYLLNLYNYRDPVLKRYHALYRHSRAMALGYSGMYTEDMGRLATRVEQQDVTDSVRCSHDAINYLHSPCVLQHIREVLFWQPVRGDAEQPLTGERVAKAR